MLSPPSRYPHSGALPHYPHATSNARKTPVPYRTYPMKEYYVYLALVGYFVIAISMTMFLKWFFSGYGFNFPVTSLLISFAVEWVLALSVQMARPKAERQVRWSTIIKCLAPIGVATALEISFSCLSLLTLSVSFHVMVKCTMPIAVLLCSFAFGIEPIQLKLVGVVLVVCGGITICTWGADTNGTEFAWSGFIWILGSATAAGFRWSLSQLYLQERFFSPRIHPITLLYFVLPVACVTLLPFFFYLEHARLVTYLAGLEQGQEWRILGMCSVMGVFGFGLICSELFLIEATSSVTLSMCSIGKELTVIMLSVIFNHDHLTVRNMFGFAVALVGIYMYKKHKHSSSSRKVHQDADAESSGYADGSATSCEGQRLL